MNLKKEIIIINIIIIKIINIIIIIIYKYIKEIGWIWYKRSMQW